MREKILEAAIEQFSKYGVRSVTMDDIARHLGISKKTLYQEFADKKELVKIAFDQILRRDQNMIEALMNDSDDQVIETLVHLSRMMRERLQSINPVTIMEVQKYFPDAWQIFVRHKEEVILSQMMDILERGKNLGYFRQEIEVPILARIRVDQITSAMDSTNFQDANYDIVKIQLEMMDHFLHGIFTEKGREAYKTQQENTI
ncbi:TetR/AcrR family transcriptional regulator [Algoriphagus kandeliae]|uniref:TetR/AcrR family transcriptional regulator n=1 Tax=Algoriphagus kandeliae TaxID=2562278 RepID=A0A4Y9QQ08_9BACT|nr:TetR/AcrR family transcriptional regulator [Algoriphagus kandeliae]TFV94267.1 TetR/AcrR family transcriptional regulator [Algoriphagus kandeliae]